MRLYAVIVTFNRLERLKKTIEITLAENPEGVLVVNNASTDGTAEWLCSFEDNRLKVLDLPENKGGAGGFHAGFKWIVENTSAEWLVCYDDDAYPQTGALSAFERLPITENVGGIAAAVYLPDGKIDEMNRPSINPFKNIKTIIIAAIGGRMGFHISDDCYRSKNNTVIEQSSFVGLFLRVSLVRDVWGYPDEKLFIYADDMIYTNQVSLSGYDIVFAPEVVFFHDCITLVGQKDVYDPLWKVFYTYRNRLKLFRIMAGTMFWAVVLPKIFVWILNARYYENKKAYFKVSFIAILDGLSGRFDRSHVDVKKISGC